MADHRVFAACWDLLSRGSDAAGFADRRHKLLASASGRVLEVGAGTGSNLPHYDRASSVLALEPDVHMRKRLLGRLGRATVPVEVVEATIDEAVLAPESFDTAVCTLVLCSVPDQRSALAVIRSALRPGGRLLFVEHVAVPGWRGRIQRRVAPVWGRLFGGCQPDRDTIGAIRAAGFFITDCERFTMTGAGPARHAVQGIARLPTADAA